MEIFLSFTFTREMQEGKWQKIKPRVKRKSVNFKVDKSVLVWDFRKLLVGRKYEFGLEGLCQAWVQGDMGLVCTEVRLKKISAAGMTRKLLVTAMTWIEDSLLKKGYNLSYLVRLQGRWRPGKPLLGGNSAAKIFFFGVRRKEKTPNQYAETINVYANESLTKKTRKIKGTKWILMDMCLSMPTDNTPLETNIKSKS